MRAASARACSTRTESRSAAFTLLASRLLLAGLAMLVAGACGGDRDAGAPGAATSGESGDAAPPTLGGGSEVEPVRLARAALLSADIPLPPGADGLDATEYEANTAPFIAVDFFTTAPPESVVGFYDRALKDRTRRRNTSLEPGVVRYEFARDYSGVAVKPWDPQGVDSTAMLARFDRRDMQGVSTEELDRYGKFLARARTHVVANLPRPEPEMEGG